MTTPTILPDSGPISAEQLFEIWKAAVDSLYAQALVEKGDGFGLEAFGQMFAQLARVSQAIDVSTQSMFIQPWSGQSNEPAAGPANATVELTFTRAKRLELPMTITGSVPVEEQTTDWGELPGDGQQTVLTGRRYRLVAPLVFPPGEPGPLTATAVAEGPGWGYNNPLPGSISAIDQVGLGFQNTGATVPAATTFGGSVVARGVPDVFVPDMVGQYVLFTAGANVGKLVRATGYVGPAGTDGGTLNVERELAFGGTLTGTFAAGESVRQAVTGAEGVVLGANAGFLVVAPRPGAAASDFNGTNVVTGLSSGATFAPAAIVQDDKLAAEAGAASWRIFGWADDWGLTCANALQPTGGRLGFLDELGHERNVPRGPGELDPQYRERVSTPADVVSPNALIRAANRVLAPVGLTGCFREAGQEGLPGWYFDADDRWDEGAVQLTPTSLGAWQEGENITQLDPATGIVALGRALMGPALTGISRTLDSILPLTGTFQTGLALVGQRSGATFTPGGGGLVQNPDDAAIRYRWFFSFDEMRAFFIESVPRVNFGEFGFAWDAGSFDFFDDWPYAMFFDGFPASAAAFYRTVWLAQEAARAGGVGHDLVLDDGPCP